MEEERDSLQCQAGGKQHIIKSVALLDTELALLREASEKRSKELEESLSIHQADLHAARERIDVTDNAMTELKDDKASLEARRDPCADGCVGC